MVFLSGESTSHYGRAAPAGVGAGRSRSKFSLDVPERKARAALAAVDDLRDSTINVDVDNSVITLRGDVGSAAQKAAAEKAAKGIEGQKGVKNNLAVKPAGSGTNTNAKGNTNTKG